MGEVESRTASTGGSSRRLPLPPPPPTSSGRPLPLPARPAGSSPPPRSRSTAPIVVVLIILALAVPVTLFSFGEDLFGSDGGTIDEYNEEVLASCDVPAGSTLVHVMVVSTQGPAGDRDRGMAFVYASPLTATELATAVGLDVGTEDAITETCRYGNRPLGWALPVATATDRTSELFPRFWGDDDADVRVDRPLPEGTRSVLRLWIAQQERDGLFG